MSVPMPTFEQVKMVSVARRLVAEGKARRIREDARLSLHEMGAFVGVGASTILRWERGDRMPTFRLAVRYGRALSDLADAHDLEALRYQQAMLLPGASRR